MFQETFSHYSWGFADKIQNIEKETKTNDNFSHKWNLLNGFSEL